VLSNVSQIVILGDLDSETTGGTARLDNVRMLEPPAPPDGDGDGVPDASDSCPAQGGPASNGGCPVTGTQPNVRCDGLIPTKFGTAAAETITGTPGRDVIASLGGADTVRGVGGGDIICTGGGTDIVGYTVKAGSGNDTVNGGAGNDNLSGEGAQRHPEWGRGPRRAEGRPRQRQALRRPRPRHAQRRAGKGCSTPLRARGFAGAQCHLNTSGAHAPGAPSPAAGRSHL
jgi:hypothetical protein